MENSKKLEALTNEAQENLKLFFEKGNKSAGTRARKALNEIRVLALELRKEISQEKNK